MTSLFSVFIALLLTSSLSQAANKCETPEKIAKQIVELTDKLVSQIDKMELESGKKLEKIQKKVDGIVSDYRERMLCLKAAGAITEDDIATFDRRIELLRQAATDKDLMNKILGEGLDDKFDSNDPTNVYALREHNKLKYLNEGSELRDETFETIRTARNFVNLSYFEYYPDRMGYTITAFLIARKLGFQKPCEIKKVTDVLGLPGPLNGDRCEDVVAETGPLKTEDYDWPSKKDLIARAQRLKQLYPEVQPLPIKIFLDDFKKLEKKLSRAGIIQILEMFAVEIKKELGILAWGSNHTKISSSEHRAVISGGNPVDKVVDWVPQKRRWRDAAILVKGELVADINHFYLSKFYKVKHWDLEDYLIKKDPSNLALYFPPLSDNEKREYNSRGRIVWSSNHDINDLTPTWKAMRVIVKAAQQSLYFENAFFSDGLSEILLERKAEKWKLRKLKKANGEKPLVSTCGKDYFDIVAKRPSIDGEPTGRHILIILPKDMDQPIVKIMEKVLTNSLVFQGVDVCKWSSDLENKVHPSNPTKFESKTMMHSKVFLADNKLTYIGTANLNRRSMAGDLEIGILTDDAQVVKDVHDKMFVSDVEASEAVKFNILNYIFWPVLWIVNILHFT